MELSVRHNSVRSQKARAYYTFKGVWRYCLIILAVGLLLSGGAMLYMSQPVGWALLGAAVLPYMLLKWWREEASRLPARSTNPQYIDDIVDAQVLGLLPARPTASDIAATLPHIQGSHFMAVRLGVTAQMMQNISAEIPSTNGVWQDADALRQELGAKDIQAPMIMYALLKNYPGYDLLLAQLHIDLEDVKKCARWYIHIGSIYKELNRKRYTGGIARDWSFGYTPLLDRYAHNISRDVMYGNLLIVDTQQHIESMQQTAQALASRGHRSVALIGDDGVGKTSTVFALAAKMVDTNSDIPDALRFHQVFMVDAASLVASSQEKGQLEQLMIRILNEAYNAKNIILCFDNAQLFFKNDVGAADVSNILQPVIEGSGLPVVLAMNEQHFLEIGQRNPAFAGSLHRINVSESNERDTMAIAQDQLILFEQRDGVRYTYQALREAYRLSERYIHDVAMPGKMIQLLKSSSQFAEDRLVTINSVQATIEKTKNVKVSVANDAKERDRLLNLEQLIHQRMIGQERAVTVVSDALRRARAGVRNQSRPVGTFLFLGPTGVGKTELSKALADVYYGGDENIIRLDLNEFVQSSDVSRLIADGADDAMSLTAQVMKRPFSVILLDEIEKAAPEVLTTLLQVLDEGVLRDVRNREVSFRDAIFICTSNAGASTIREYIDRGHAVGQFEDVLLDELIKQGQFKPEFLNRFDEVVVFTPLEKEHLMKIVDLIIAGVNKTLEAQKVQVDVGEAVKAMLVDRGYDPRLGARPMRRVVQKVVENTVAKSMLSGEAGPGSVITITEDTVRDSLGSFNPKKEVK